MPTCNKCGRPLDNAGSIARGMGPICAEKHAAQQAGIDRLALEDLYINQPLARGIRISRAENGTVMTNVPHHVIHHSPTGYEFGYAGSGPADLALNICHWLVWQNRETLKLDAGPLNVNEKTKCFDGTCLMLAWQAHQDFKRVFIAPLDPAAGGHIAYADALAWLREYVRKLARGA